jgi:hypothetical protein
MQVLLTVMLVVSFSALLCSKCSTLLTQASESPVYFLPVFMDGCAAQLVYELM